MQKKETYTHIAMRQIVMVEGWQAVYWDEGKHRAYPLHALGLGHRNTHSNRTNAILPSSLGATPEEMWEIYGLEYSLSDGWNVAEEASNFCSLLPPGKSIEALEAESACHHMSAPLHA